MTAHSDELKQLYCQSRQALFTCALAVTGSPAAAEDAVHDAFCRLLHRPPDAEDLQAYAFRAVRNAALDQVRRGARTPEPLPEYVFDLSKQASATAEQAEFAQHVVELMNDLSADERETIVLHLYGELTFHRIAVVRELPLGTVVSSYRRGLAKLRRALEVADGPV